MNPLSSISLRLFLSIILLGSSSPTLHAQTEPTQTDYRSEELAIVLSQGEQFPHMTEEVLKRPFSNILSNHAKLVEALENDAAYKESIENHPPLLTLEINTEVKTGGIVQFKVVKESFIFDWAQELSAFVSEHGLNSSQQILNEISKILSDRPYLVTTPHDFVSALVQTLDRDVNREEIFRTLEHGDISVLESALDSYPRGRGFKPTAFALDEGGSREYYLGALREMIEVNERMNQFVTTYILATEMEIETTEENLEKYLIELTEEKLVWIMESNLQKGHVKDLAKTAKKTKDIRRRILFRIKSIEREIKRHQEIVTEHAQVSENKLTLVEVHPSIGIFRGYIGGDCSSNQCFGYPYSPEERIFLILNKRGEDVGYLNGATVNTTDSRKVFLVNGLAGARISKEMATIIFAGLSKAHRELGVEEVLILGRKHHLSNLDYTEIRRAFDSHAGVQVPVTFLDRKFREIIDRYSKTNLYDSPDKLSSGHRIENIEDIRESTRVTVSERPFESPLVDFKASDLNPRQKFFINLMYPDVALEWEITAVPDRSLIEILQNIDKLPVAAYLSNLESVRNHYSFSMEELTPYIKFDYLRGLVSAPDFFSSSLYDPVKKSLESAVAEAKTLEDIEEYITKVFPYIRGKQMGDIVERALDFTIEISTASASKIIWDKTGSDLMNEQTGVHFLLWFASMVFPYIHTPNKAEMIQKTIAAAVALNSPDVLTALSHATLPRIRTHQRKNLIELTRSATIALKDPSGLLTLGYYNNLGDERGWRIIQSMKRAKQYIFFHNLNRLTTRDHEQQKEILRRYFSLTPQQFFDFFAVDELIGRIIAKDANVKSNGDKILELFSKIIASKNPISLQRLVHEVLAHFVSEDVIWEIAQATIEAAIEIGDSTTIEKLEEGFFSKNSEASTQDFNVIRSAVHEFFNDKDWRKLRIRFQSATTLPAANQTTDQPPTQNNIANQTTDQLPPCF